MEISSCRFQCYSKMYLWDFSKSEAYFSTLNTLCGWRKEHDKEAAAFILLMVFKKWNTWKKTSTSIFKCIGSFFSFQLIFPNGLQRTYLKPDCLRLEFQSYHFSTCATLDKLFNLSVPCFYDSHHGNISNYLIGLLWGFNEWVHVKALRIVLATYCCCYCFSKIR